MNIRNNSLHIIYAWKTALQSRSFGLKLFLFPILFIFYSAITQHLGHYIEARQGIRLEDKLVTLFPSRDFSIEIFALLYTSLFLLVITHLSKPAVILRIIEMHFLVAVVRQICILMVALEPPAGMIVLRDVFLENTIYPQNSPLTKDLFFSGHVASIWIYFLCSQRRYFKYSMLAASVAMSFMILSMRVHYSYDVFGAMAFTTVIYFAPFLTRQYITKTKEYKYYGSVTE
jgi:PAP2 superfamily C-terminal